MAPGFDRLSDERLEEGIRMWREHQAPADQPGGFDQLVEKGGGVRVLSHLADRYWQDRAAMARAVKGARSLACRKGREIRTIGTHYRWISNGGIQRVLCHLLSLWTAAGYEVVLFTDEPPSPDDYPIPERVRRVVLPAWNGAGGTAYGPRAEVWKQVLEEQGVDTMVFHTWASETLFWDVLAVKLQGIPCVIHTHVSFLSLLDLSAPFFQELPAVVALGDALVAVSRVDRHYWSHFAARAVYLPNPLMMDLGRTPCSRLDTLDVLWVGRLAKGKRPVDAVRIMARVIRSVPSARLRMLGAGLDEEWSVRIREEIARLGIQDQVELCGYHPDVGRFYEAASVYLSTSASEGFSMALAESQAYGLPCVMYELPHVEICRTGGGIAWVGQEDVEGAAEKIIELLKDGEYRRQMGRAARQSIEQMAAFDLVRGWKDVLEGVGKSERGGGESDLENETDRIMMRMILSGFAQLRAQEARAVEKRNEMRQGLEKNRERMEQARQELEEARAEQAKLRGALDQAREKQAKTQRALEGVRTKLQGVQQALERSRRRQRELKRSFAYRIGRAMMFLPSKAYGWAVRGRPPPD